MRSAPRRDHAGQHAETHHEYCIGERHRELLDGKNTEHAEGQHADQHTSNNHAARVRFDCNRGRGTWQAPGPHELTFGQLALTRVLCPPGSLHDRLVKDWAFVRTYTLRGGHLYLALMADAGIYEFEPMK